MSRLPVFVIFLLYFSSVVFSETCPHPEDIFPCSCSYEGTHSDIIITCSKVKYDDIESAFSHLQGKKVRDVIFRNLTRIRIPSVFFWGLNIRKIHFEDTELESIADGEGKPAFLGLDNSLEVLSIAGGFSVTGIYRFKSLNIQHLRRLTTLSISSNNIQTMANEWIKPPGSITDLRISDNRIDALGDRIFAYLGNLKTFWFNGNRQRSFRRSVLPRPARNIIEINLSNNNLVSIPDDMFVDMPALRNVFLQGNGIQRLPATTYTRVWEQLEHLNLSGNPLECDEHIEWMLKLKRPNDLTGVCAVPPKAKGLHLKSFIDNASNSTTLPKRNLKYLSREMHSVLYKEGK